MLALKLCRRTITSRKLWIWWRGVITSSMSYRSTRDVDKSPERRENSVLEKVLVKKGSAATTADKVKQRAKNMVLYSAFIASVAVLCGMCYLMYEQIFSPGSPQSVFSKSLTAIRTDPECKYFLGEKIKGYGEETYRGRRRHLAHHLYTKEGHERIRVRFHVKGAKREAVATAEMEKMENKWNWRFLIIESLDPVPETIIVIDNR